MRKLLIGSLLVIAIMATAAAWMGQRLPDPYHLLTSRTVTGTEALYMDVSVDEAIELAWKTEVGAFMGPNINVEHFSELLKPLPSGGIKSHIDWSQQDMATLNVVFYYEVRQHPNGAPYRAITDVQFSPSYILFAYPDISATITSEGIKRLREDSAVVAWANNLAREYYNDLLVFSDPKTVLPVQGYTSQGYHFTEAEAAQLRSYAGALVVMSEHQRRLTINDKDGKIYCPDNIVKDANAALRKRAEVLNYLDQYLTAMKGEAWTYTYVRAAISLRPVYYYIRGNVILWRFWLIWIALIVATPCALLQLWRPDFYGYVHQQLRSKSKIETFDVGAAYVAVVREMPRARWWMPRVSLVQEVIERVVAKAVASDEETEFMARAEKIYLEAKRLGRGTARETEIAGQWGTVKNPNRKMQIRKDALSQIDGIRHLLIDLQSRETPVPSAPKAKPATGPHVSEKELLIQSLPSELRDLKQQAFWLGLSTRQIGRISTAYNVLGLEVKHLLALNNLALTMHLRANSAFLDAITRSDKARALEALGKVAA